jgi:hypothetical protein
MRQNSIHWDVLSQIDLPPEHVPNVQDDVTPPTMFVAGELFLSQWCRLSDKQFHPS